MTLAYCDVSLALHINGKHTHHKEQNKIIFLSSSSNKNNIYSFIDTLHFSYVLRIICICITYVKVRKISLYELYC